MLLKRSYEPKYALVPNVFIEKYMKDVQGDILKVYLWLLRLSEKQWEDIPVAYIADRLDCMEKDVRRALTILEKQGILKLEYEDSQISGIVLANLDEKEDFEGREKFDGQDEFKSNRINSGKIVSAKRVSVKNAFGSDGLDKKAVKNNTFGDDDLDSHISENNNMEGTVSGFGSFENSASGAAVSDEMRRGNVDAAVACLIEEKSDAAGLVSDDTDADISGGLRKDGLEDGWTGSDENQTKAEHLYDEADYDADGEYTDDKELISEEDNTYPQFEISSDPEYRYMVIAIERYLGRTLTSTDISLFDLLHKEYDFSYELIEYLVEYCVELGKKNIRYIEKVALSWAREGKMSVAELKEERKAFRKENRAVMKAFGITGRVLGDKERSFVDKWLKEQHFNLDVVIEACDNTMTAIQGPSFEYTDKILSEWKKAGVVTVEDARKVSEEYKKAAAQQYGKGSGNKGALSRSGASGNSGAPNRFHNFEQRKIDYDALLADEIGLKKRKKAKPKNGSDERPDEKAGVNKDNNAES